MTLLNRTILRKGIFSKIINGFKFKDLLNFEVMLFPKVASVFYFILTGISILFGFVSVIRGFSAQWGGGAMVISGLLTILIAPFLIRLWFEFVLVIFMVYEKISKIHTSLLTMRDTQE